MKNSIKSMTYLTIIGVVFALGLSACNGLFGSGDEEDNDCIIRSFPEAEEIKFSVTAQCLWDQGSPAVNKDVTFQFQKHHCDGSDNVFKDDAVTDEYGYARAPIYRGFNFNHPDDFVFIKVIVDSFQYTYYDYFEKYFYTDVAQKPDHYIDIQGNKAVDLHFDIVLELKSEPQ